MFTTNPVTLTFKSYGKSLNSAITLDDVTSFLFNEPLEIPAILPIGFGKSLILNTLLSFICVPPSSLALTLTITSLPVFGVKLYLPLPTLTSHQHLP